MTRFGVLSASVNELHMFAVFVGLDVSAMLNGYVAHAKHRD